MNNLELLYGERRERYLRPVATALEGHIANLLAGQERIDRICARAKTTERFMHKANKMIVGKSKYTAPLAQIQDQIGARVIVYYASDVERISQRALKYLRHIEERTIIPDDDSEFGYIGKHFIMIIPREALVGVDMKENDPRFFELQIKTVFQHAWSECEHDLGYKPRVPITSLQRRQMAFTAAQAWGADRIFQELFDSLSITQPEDIPSTESPQNAT